MSVGTVVDSEGNFAGHLALALAAGGCAVIVGRAVTVATLGEELDARGFEIDALVREGRLVVLDAESALAGMHVDHAIDPYRFSATIEATLRCLVERAGGKPIHAVSELASLVAGDPLARGRIDDLWHTACAELGVVPETSQSPLAATSQMQKLLVLGNDLAAARTRDEVIARMLDQGMGAVEAAAISIWSIAGDDLEPLGVSSLFAELATSITVQPLAGDSPLAAAARTGEPVFLRCAEAYRASFPASYEQMAAHLPFRELALAALPLIGSSGAVVGGVMFTYRGNRELSATERAFAAILARQCALALERLQAQEQERALRYIAEQARYETEVLDRLIATLNGTDSANEVFELALETVEAGAHCERSAILLFDHENVMRFRAHHGLSAAYRAAVDGHSPWTADTVDPDPVTVDDVELAPAWAAFRETFRAEQIRALAFVPLVHRRRVVGKLMLYRAQARPFTARELELATTAAHHVALAVERTAAQHALARAFSVERAAHLEAAEATRAREEIISVVSHDLRSPLGAILVGASSLLTDARTRDVAGRIHRQAERMARQLDDLVDFAAIQSGRVALSRAPHPPGTIVDAASDMFAALATEQGLRLDATLAPDLPVIECDSERAIQVMANLVANALKVTPRGGSIEIGAAPRDRDDVVFFVKDTGPGIPPEDQAQLFERFWRGKSATYKGSGLGLSIARGIVDAHGGRIWVESQLGRGTTFYFSLST